jgi:hypothetical protein
MSSNAFNASAAEYNDREERRQAHALARAIGGLMTAAQILRSERLPYTAKSFDQLAGELLATLPTDLAETVRAFGGEL